MSQQKAIFAGGCFWCSQSEFDGKPGVSRTVSGYIGGTADTANYTAVCSGRTQHIEAVLVEYDPEIISYSELLDLYWRHIDPTDAGGQFADRGSQYQPVIYTFDQAQKEVAQASLDQLQASNRFVAPVAVEIKPATPFFDGEDYHQNYHQSNPGHYQAYREGSGRQPFINQHWKS